MPVRLTNVAASGQPVSECLRLYPQLVAPLFAPGQSSNIIVFHAGDNDIARRATAAQTYAAFTEYVATAHRQGWKVVVSTELRRYGFSPDLLAALLDYNDRLRANAAGADAVVDLDQDPRFVRIEDRSDPGLFTHDGVHPSDGGYAVLAAMLAPAVRRVGSTR
jgi:lysophospholipase L1-like esterase